MREWYTAMKGMTIVEVIEGGLSRVVEEGKVSASD